MKKCPYCAEMIQDEAIKCRYCHSDLTIAPPAAAAPVAAVTSAGFAEQGTSEPEPEAPEPVPAETAPEPSAKTAPEPSAETPTEPAAGVATTDAQTPIETSSVRYTHSGFRYVLGYGADFFGIWDRQSPTVPAERFPRTDDGWRQAWLRFAALEPDHTTVPADGAAASTTAATQTQPGAGAVAMDPSDTTAVQYTHSGSRYLLGYGRTFFGIWDRQAPALPVERFARDDSGWAAAWARYTQLETNFTEVKLG